MNGYMLWSFKSRFQLVYIPWKLLEIKQKDLFRPISHSINTRRKCISGHDYARTRHSLLCMAAKLLWPNWPGWATLTLAAVSVLFTALTRLNAQALSVSVQETQETKPEQNSTLDIHRIIRIFLMFRHFSFLNSFSWVHETVTDCGSVEQPRLYEVRHLAGTSHPGCSRSDRAMKMPPSQNRDLCARHFINQVVAQPKLLSNSHGEELWKPRWRPLKAAVSKQTIIALNWGDFLSLLRMSSAGVQKNYHCLQEFYGFGETVSSVCIRICVCGSCGGPCPSCCTLVPTQWAGSC